MTRLDDLIRAMLDGAESWTNAGVAQKLCDTEPEAVADYLHTHRVLLVTEVVAAIGRSWRSHAAATRSRSVFADAVDTATVTQWREGFGAAAFAVDETNTQKRVAHMTHGDLLFVAGGFERRQEESRLMAAVFRAVAARVRPGEEVCDVFTADELEDLRRRVLGLND